MQISNTTDPCDITSTGRCFQFNDMNLQRPYQNRALSTMFSFVMSSFLFWGSKCIDFFSREFLSSKYSVFEGASPQGCDIMLMVKKYMTFRRIMSSFSGSSSPLF